MQVVFFHPLYAQSMFLLRRVALGKLLSLEVVATSIIITLSFHIDCNSLYTAVFIE